MLDAILGAGASQAILGIGAQQANQGQYGQSMYSNQQAISQMQRQYSQAQQARFTPHEWVFNGKACTLHEFADKIWPGEHEDKMLFILTHSGPKVK
jgi:hypothetical protein